GRFRCFGSGIALVGLYSGLGIAFRAGVAFLLAIALAAALAAPPLLRLTFFRCFGLVLYRFRQDGSRYIGRLFGVGVFDFFRAGFARGNGCCRFVIMCGVAIVAILAATAPAPPTPLAVAALTVLGRPGVLLGLAWSFFGSGVRRRFFAIVLDIDFGLFRLVVDGQGAGLDKAGRLFGNGTARDGIKLRSHRIVGLDGDRQAEA